MLLRLMALVTAVVHMVSSQDGGGTILDQGNAAESQSVIVTPRTRAFLSCESGDIVVKVNFTLPFRGLMYAHRSRSSPCRVHGTGGQYYELRIPLKGCGTWQESPRVFVNNITIRFHSALELEEDETKTVVCRYPPPLTQTPGSIQIIEPHPITPTMAPTRVSTARLSEVEILILICLLLFLSLLTLGIGIAYFCLKRRHVRIIRRQKPSTSSSPPSQITRLSSSNMPSSSVLGHTVRIPRAVPYSGRALSSAMSMSASPIEEDYPTSSSAEATSAEETSVSTSSSEDQSRNLLYPKGGPKSFLLIPKAILRKAGSNRWKTQPPVVHQYSATTGSAASTSAKVLEMEDQTVTTVLEPENHFEDDSYWILKQKESMQQDGARSTAKVQSPFPNTASPIPVYAQVDKNKKNIATTHQEIILEKKMKSARQHPPPQPTPGIARRQRQVVTETPEERKTSEEVTKNTTVTTSVRREVKETRVLSPSLMEDLREAVAKRESKSYDASGEPSGPIENIEQSSALSTKATALNPQKPPKSILIRDVSDVYLTTTVETELRELTTKVSKDVVERHAKVDDPDNRLPKKVDALNEPLIPDTHNWNVIIRHRSPEVPTQEGTDLEASGESNGESVDSSPPPPSEPQFHVKIRTIPPEELQSKKLEQMMSIPPLEMPSAIGKLREALKPNLQEERPVSENDGNNLKNPMDMEDKSNLPQQQRTVRWTKDTKDASSTVSSSDSFQSSESLRERSSSEVLEVAPTLPSQQHKKNQPPMLERSTSEIVTSPEDHSRWVGGVVPVLESLSPEFLANIPVVMQGGFFNSRQQQPSTSANSTKDTKKT